jgi:uncharacterized membrane protein YfcA
VSTIDLVLANLALMVGAIVQGAVGFGAMLVGIPFLLLIEPDLVPGSALVASVPLGIAILARDHHHGHLREVGWPLVGRAIGAPIGVAVLVAVPPEPLGLLYGFLLLAAVLASASRWTVAPTHRNGFIAGTISGFSGTTVGVGGPPVAIVYQADAGPVLRANLSRYFLVGLAISLTSLAIGGELGVDRIRAGLTLVPGLLIGAAVSGRVAEHLDRGWAQPAVLAVSTVAAVIVLIRALGA